MSAIPAYRIFHGLLGAQAGGAPPAPTSADVALRQIVTGTTPSVGSTIVISGLSFAPKFIFCWFNGTETGSGGGDSNATAYPGYGVAINGAQRMAAACSVSAVANMIEFSHHRDDAVMAHMGGTTRVIPGAIAVQSWDAGGVTFVVTALNSFGASRLVNVLLVGGSGVTNVAIGDITEPGSTGTVNITAPGFKPDLFGMVFTSCASAAPSSSADGAGSMLSLGFAANPSGVIEQWVMSHGNIDLATTSVCLNYIKVGEIASLYNAAVTATDFRAAVSAFTSTGVDLNVIERAGSRRGFWIAVKGGKYRAGTTIVSSVDETLTAVSGRGFQPKAVAFGEHRGVEDAADTPSEGTKWSFGAGATGDTSRSMATATTHNVGTSNIGRREWDASVLIATNASGAEVNRVELESYDADGFSTRTKTPEAVNAVAPYVMIG